MVTWHFVVIAAAVAATTRVAALPIARTTTTTMAPFGPSIPRTFTPFVDEVERNAAFMTLRAAAGLQGQDDAVSIATQFVRSKVNSDFYVESAYTSDLTGMTHVYVRQRVNGLDVMNGKINVHVDKHGNIVTYGDSFFRPKHRSWFVKAFQQGLQVIYSTTTTQAQLKLSPEQAVVALMEQVGMHDSAAEALDRMTTTTSLTDGFVLIDNVPQTLSPVRAKPAYLQAASGDLVEVWDVEMELEDHWYHAQVHADNGRLGALADWVADAATYYNVIPFGNNDPSDTQQVLVKNPHDRYASPEGWHAQGTHESGHMMTFNVTIGNNAYTHTNPDGGYSWEQNYRPSGKIDYDTGDVIFNYTADFVSQQPIQYEDAAVTNLFYWVNMAHDLYYRYGFDEKAGNFQQDNLGRGRKGDDCANDAVIANAQDGSGRNNANFATPPDGRHGKMRMYVWDQTQPMRDGDFESGIVIHEYTHGVSNRLTGGPKDSSCLGWGEAGGMGEGWGDFVATIIRMTEHDTPESEFGMGDWANGGQGIRKYKYSTSMKTNPSTYAIMDRFDYWGVHAKGEVWAEMLYEVYWALVGKHGYTAEWFPPLPGADGDLGPALDYIRSHGNTLALKLVLDGMALQPCNPGFVEARDAILAADKALTGGENYCTIYKAFAKRGLGYGAKLTREDNWYEKRIESYTLKEGECEEV
ncbi:Fungalysin metallopeptidase-domain-containing protein [Dichotomocladium elegans]|nr:Fungalysin metallopeptidase-domain-containing protein [Dichotomocladium elegans]